MQKLLLLVGLLFSFGFGSVAAADSSNDFMRARRLIARGDELELAGNTEGAREQYSTALEKLRAIQQAAPDWEARPVEDQIKYCLDRIWKAQGKVRPAASDKSPIKNSPKSESSKSQNVKNTEPTKSKASSPGNESKPKVRPQGKETPKEQVRIQEPAKSTSRNEASARPKNSGRVQEGASNLELTKRESAGKTASKPPKEEGSPDVTQENRQLKGRLENAREEMKDLQRVHSGESSLLRVKLAKVEAQLDELKRQKGKGTEEGGELKENLKAATEEFRKANEAQNKRFQKLLQENNSLKEDLKIAKAEIQKTIRSGSEGQLNAVLSENEQLKRKIHKLEESRAGGSSDGELNPLKEELSKSRAQIENLQKENEFLKTANATLKPATESNEKRIQDLLQQNTELKSARADLAKAQAQLEVLQKENDSFKLASSTRTAAMESKEEYFATVLNENNLLKAKMGKLEKGLQDFHSHREEIKPVKLELAKVRAMLEISKREGENLRASLDALKGPSGDVAPRAVSVASQPQISSPKPEKESLSSEPVRLEAATSNAATSPGVGEIVLLNSRDQFVVVNYGVSKVPSTNIELGVYRDGARVGSLKVTPPVRPPFVTADLVSGTARRGDVVR